MTNTDMTTEEHREDKKRKRQTAPPPFTPDETGVDKAFLEIESEGWHLHVESSEWMFHPKDGVYFHVPTETVWGPSEDSPSEFVPINSVVPTDADVGDNEADDLQQSDLVGAEEQEDEVGEDEDELEIDLDKVVKCAAAEKVGLGKSESEDRHIVRETLPLDVLSSDCTSCCYASAVFDGHGGARSAEYCATHLFKNILASYRQIAATLLKKREALLLRRPDLNQRRIQREMQIEYPSIQLTAFTRSITKGFELTERNFLEFARRSKRYDGTTVLCVFVFGPDEDGSLRLITAHSGDSRAVLSDASGTATRLTEDHKPQRPDEKQRIESLGGYVVNVDGVWRVTRLNCILTLSVSRAIGDRLLKEPKEIIAWHPEISVLNVDLDKHIFVLLATDGIWDCIGDQEACDYVRDGILSNEPGGLEEIAKVLIDTAVQRKGMDDKTVVIMHLELPDAWEAARQMGAKGKSLSRQSEEEEVDDEIFAQ